MYVVQFTKEKKEGISILHIQGRMDANTSSRIEQKIKEILDEENASLIIDLSKVEYLSSAGLRLMIWATKKYQGKGLDLLFCNLVDEVKEIIKMAGFESILRIFPQENAALAALKKA